MTAGILVARKTMMIKALIALATTVVLTVGSRVKGIPSEARSLEVRGVGRDWEVGGTEYGGQDGEYMDISEGRNLVGAVGQRRDPSRWVTACTTVVIATFPAGACESYTTPAPACRFTFRQRDTRQLYDCRAVARLNASTYLDTPPPGLQVSAT